MKSFEKLHSLLLKRERKTSYPNSENKKIELRGRSQPPAPSTTIQITFALPVVFVFWAPEVFIYFCAICGYIGE